MQKCSKVISTGWARIELQTWPGLKRVSGHINKQQQQQQQKKQQRQQRRNGSRKCYVTSILEVLIYVWINFGTSSMRDLESWRHVQTHTYVNIRDMILSCMEDAILDAEISGQVRCLSHCAD